MKALVISCLVLCLCCSCLSQMRAGASGQTFNSNGVPIYYTVEGKGEPVVLIHGLHSSAELNWHAPGISRALATSFQVIALDLRGHGRSGKPEHETDYGVQLAEDVIRLLDHLKLDQAHIVGYSLGGMIALKLTVKHPQRVRSLTLGGMGWLREGSVLRDIWQRAGEREGARTPAACIRSIGELAVSEEEVKALRVPATVLVGDRDPMRRLYVAPLQTIRPDWPVSLIAEAGHLNCVIKSQFKEELKKWLERNARR